MVLSITTFATVSRRSFVIIALFSSIGLVSVIWCTKTAASTAAAESASITWHGLFINPICTNEVGKLDYVKSFFTFSIHWLRCLYWPCNWSRVQLHFTETPDFMNDFPVCLFNIFLWQLLTDLLCFVSCLWKASTSPFWCIRQFCALRSHI